MEHYIKEVVDFLRSYFNEAELTKLYSTSCLILIHNVNNPDSFSDRRPIDLSNFTKKILSKILNDVLDHILPIIIFENQSGFVHGTLITENIMLAQEINHGIKRKMA